MSSIFEYCGLKKTNIELNILCFCTTVLCKRLFLFIYFFYFLALPTLLHSMKSYQFAVKGKTTILTCKGKGNPQPRVKWFKNGQELNTTDRIALSLTSAVNKVITSTLTIGSTEYTDSGDYTCLFENILGKAQQAGKITVQGRSSAAPKNKMLSNH